MAGLLDDCLGAVLGPLCESLFKSDSYGIFDALQSLKRGQAPALKTGYKEVIALYRESLPEHFRVLFDRFHFCDLAVKAVGVSRVGTWCGVGLFLAADDAPLFLRGQRSKGLCA